MERPNEMIFGHSAERLPKEQMDMMETFNDVIRQDEFAELRQIRSRLVLNDHGQHRSKIRNFGESAATETIGLLGVWLSQFSEAEVQCMVERNRKRRRL